MLWRKYNVSFNVDKALLYINNIWEVSIERENRYNLWQYGLTIIDLRRLGGNDIPGFISRHNRPEWITLYDFFLNDRLQIWKKGFVFDLR